MSFKLLGKSLACFTLFYGYKYQNQIYSYCNENNFKKYKFPSRDQLLHSLRKEEGFDVVIIGGGATGAGVAYEASRIGLSVALVERGDFSSGTSSKSTKLIHGGIRYLEKAFMNLDRDEFYLVKESLRERTLLLESCPHLVKKVPILLPIYSYFDAVRMFIGLKLYDFISGGKDMASYPVSKSKALEMFPYLNGDKLVCGFIYFDGQQDDSRMNLSVIKTAISKGAVACNYVEMKDFVRENGKIKGILVKDKIKGDEFTCHGKCIVNATGPFTDKVRHFVDEKAQDICIPSSGVHLSMSKELTSSETGILIYEDDNRVLFVLPWEGVTLVGTTDVKCDVADKPEPNQSDVKYIIDHFNRIVKPSEKVALKDVKSAWSGLRPLVVDPKLKSTSSTAKISRTHLIEVNDNIISISGGKWTTFRKMGQEVVESALQVLRLDTKYESVLHSSTFGLCYTSGWTENHHLRLKEDYKLPHNIALYLSNKYGTESEEIAKLMSKNSTFVGNILHQDFPYTEEEVSYICRNEYVCKIEDILGRRFRLSFLDTKTAYQLVPIIAEIASRELKWSETKKQEEIREAYSFLDNEMGMKIIDQKKLQSELKTDL